MPANQYGIDLGEVYRTQAAVQGARTRNKLADLQLSEAEREIKMRPIREREAMKRQNILTGVMGQAATGSEDAQRQLLVLDPQNGPKFLDAISKMDERKLKQVQKSVDEMGRLSTYVLQGKTPEEQERRYRVMYEGVSPEIQKSLPEAYNREFIELSVAKAGIMDKITQNPKLIKFGDEDRLYSGGKLIEKTKRPTKSAEKPRLDRATEKDFRSAAASYFGGFTDPVTGEISGLLKSDTPKVQSIAKEASKIFRDNKNVTRNEAIEMAAERLGIVPALKKGQQDPLGLRQ